MAEFQEVMRQYDRMCTAHAGCFNCPLHKPDGVSDLCSISAFINDSERIEREVMGWAAVHPEPSYPTWGEWLCNMHVVGVQARQVPLPNLYYTIESAMHKPIPADIAQKLGIDPKKVTNDG